MKRLALCASSLIGLGCLGMCRQPMPKTQQAIATPVSSPKSKAKPPAPTAKAKPTLQASRWEIPGFTTLQEWMVFRALARTIFWTEGTGGTGKPYNIAFTFAEFQSFADHPRQIICSGDLCSDASGAAQWLSTTYDAVRQRNRNRFWFNDGYFSPRNQDLALLYHLAEIGAYETLMRGVSVANGRIYVNKENFKAVAWKLCPVWASWPSNERDSEGCYGQGARTLEEPWSHFLYELDKEQKG